MANFDAARRNPMFLGDSRFELGHVDHVFGRSVKRCPVLEDRLQIAAEIGVLGRNRLVEQAVVAEHGAFAGFRQHDPLMAQIATDGAGVGAHRNGRQPHAGIGAKICHEHALIGLYRVFLVQVERVRVLHQEFAAAHGAEARTHLVAELPLDVVEVQRQILVGLHIAAENVGDHFLIGRPKEELALMAIFNAQHFLAIGIIAAAFAPQVGRLDRGHEQLHRTRAVLLFLDDLLHLHQNLVAQRQPGIEAGGLLADHAGAQHQAMRDDFGFLGYVAQHWQKVTRQAHVNSRKQPSTQGFCCCPLKACSST